MIKILIDNVTLDMPSKIINQKKRKINKTPKKIPLKNTKPIKKKVSLKKVIIKDKPKPVKKPIKNKVKSKKLINKDKPKSVKKKVLSEKPKSIKITTKTIIPPDNENKERNLYWIGPYGCLIPSYRTVVVAEDGFNTLYREGGETELGLMDGNYITKSKYLSKYTTKGYYGLHFYNY